MGLAYGPATAPVASSAVTYTQAGQVGSLAHTWNGSALNLTYSYNKDHQRSGLTASDATFLPSGLTPGSATYTANTLNQYTAVSGTAFTYDKRGNLTSDGVWTFGYNTENQLISASKTGVTATYSYDPFGRRKWKTVNGVTTAWALFGNQEIAEYQGTGTIFLSRRFVYGSGLDEPIASVNPSNARTYQFQDALGSVIALTNASGLVTEKYAYTANGQTVATGPSTAAYRYTGRRWDAETGLYFYRARAYSPALGRFLQADPIGTAGGINLYARIASLRMLPDKFPPMTRAASPNRVGGAHGGDDQHGCATRGAGGGGGALPGDGSAREGSDTRRALRDDGLASQACVTRSI